MTTITFNPEKALVILLGASTWPHRANFRHDYGDDNNPFKRSVGEMRAYFLDYLKMPKDNLKDLFDAKEKEKTDTFLKADSLLEEIEKFLDPRRQTHSDVFIYYVGHGTLPDNELSLAIPASKHEDDDLSVKKLWRRLGKTMPPARCYFLLDACYSGKITEIPTKSKSPTGPKSALFFCSSPPDQQSFIRENVEKKNVTVFTEALLKTLRGENPQLQRVPPKLSFRHIELPVRQFLKTHYPDVAEPQFASVGEQTVIENLGLFANFRLTGWVNLIQEKLHQQRHDLQPIYNLVATYLKELGRRGINDSDIEKIEPLETWSQGKLNNQEFIFHWQRYQPVPTLDYSDWSAKLQEGRVVIFLGTNVPRTDIAPDLLNELKETLEYNLFDGSLPQLCEYIEMEKGRDSLCQKTANFIASRPPPPAPVELYQLLAQVKAPLVLIASEYTQLLDQALSAQQKKFVVLSPLNDWEKSEHAGKLWLRYSDADTLPQAVNGEDLDCLKFLTGGYSLIYKIRGDVKLDQQHLLLSENHYFKFACHIQHAIPNSLLNLINALGLWFIGHHPKNWEDRLIIQTILQQCQRSERKAERMAIDEGATDRFIKTFWQYRGVNSHAVRVGEFVKQLNPTGGAQ